jgi:hypothetical protein
MQRDVQEILWTAAKSVSVATATNLHRRQQLIKKAGRDLRLNRIEGRYFVKSYTKPTLVKLGSLALIKSNATGPSIDGKKYSGNFK